MKNITVTVTKKDIKKSMMFYKLWTVVFALLIIASVFLKNVVFIYHFAGMFLALVYWYLNNKHLKAKGETISKVKVSEESLKTSLWIFNGAFAIWIIFSYVIFSMVIATMQAMLIDTFFFFIFVILILYRKIITYIKYLNKK
jgi:hypothetical protein